MQHTLTQAWTRRGVLAWFLWPVSWLYGAVVALRHWLYQVGAFKTRRVSAKVIVVGNVVAGGAGKTPVVMALVEHLQMRGLKVGVVSRGYGRDTQDCREVLDNSLPQEVGDEPTLIKQALSAPVFVAIKRIEAAMALLAKYPQTQVIVCDDGLQHHALHRDLEICVFDDRGLGNGFMLPAGPLREPWPRSSLSREPWLRSSLSREPWPRSSLSREPWPRSSLSREPWPRPANLVLHTGQHPAFSHGFKATRSLATHALRAGGSKVPLASLRGKPLAAVAAIAQPEQFFSMLRHQGLTLAHTESLPDHYTFNSWLRMFDKGYSLICTEKDAVKLWRTHPEALAVPLVLTLQAAFLAVVDEVIS